MLGKNQKKKLKKSKKKRKSKRPATPSSPSEERHHGVVRIRLRRIRRKDNMDKDQKFVEMIVKEIVDNPDKVKTERKVDEMGVLIELTVAPDDMGKIIGKEGKTAKSIRTLLRVLGAKERARVNMKIIEPEGGREATGSGERVGEKVEEKVEDKVESKEEEVKPIEEKPTGVI